MSQFQRRLAILYVAAAYILIAIFTLSARYSWVHPEISIYDSFTLSDPSWAIMKTFNWEHYEFVPRMSRPISNFFQIVEGELRNLVAESILPVIPVFSPLVFLVCLILIPSLSYAIFGELGFSRETRIAVYLLALTSPTNLSHLGLFFRPAKALSELFFLICALLFIRILKRGEMSRRDQVALGFALLCGFLSDEYGALAYGFVLFYSLPGLWRLRHRMIPVMVGVPMVVGYFYFVLFPQLADWWWDLRGGVSSYFIFDKILRSGSVLHALIDQVVSFLTMFAEHLWIFPSEIFGLMLWTQPTDWFGGTLIAINTIAFIVYGLLFVRIFVNKKEIGLERRHHLSVFWRFLAFFFVSLAFHSLLMSLVIGPYGPYYYAGVACLSLVFAYCVGLDMLPKSLRLILAGPMIFANIYISVFTNQAMKRFHYYPYSHEFVSMFRAELNRFNLPFIQFFSADELARLRQLRPHQCRALPAEMSWYLVTSGFNIEAINPPGIIGNPEVCAETACCQGENRPRCVVFCGSYP